MHSTQILPQHPSSVFVSYAHEDMKFVELLVELLSFHRLRPWHDRQQRGVGASVSDKVAQALRQTESMIVVLSPAASRSTWVHRELFAFKALHPHGRLMPLKIAPFRRSKGLAELSGLELIDFTGSYVDGCRLLMQSLGREFLPRVEQRSGAGDRRQSSPAERLEFSLRRHAASELGVNLDEPLALGQSSVFTFRIIEAMHLEIARAYRLVDRAGKSVDMPLSVFRKVVIGVGAGLDGLETLVPDFMIEALVRNLTSAFALVARDRRHAAAAELTPVRPFDA